MKADIKIEKVENINLAVIREYNAEHDENEWTVFLMNQKEVEIEAIIVLIKGHSGEKKTTTFRKMIKAIPPYCSMKVELIQPELFEFTNEFYVSFYEGGSFHEINFKFSPYTIKSEALVEIPDLGARGIYGELM